jgi:hypothetical protein
MPHRATVIADVRFQAVVQLITLTASAQLARTCSVKLIQQQSTENISEPGRQFTLANLPTRQSRYLNKNSRRQLGPDADPLRCAGRVATEPFSPHLIELGFLFDLGKVDLH